MFFPARCLRARLRLLRTSGTLSCFRILDIDGKPLNNHLVRVPTHKWIQNHYFSFASAAAFQTSVALRSRILDTEDLPLFWSCENRIYHKTPCPSTQLFLKNNDKGSFNTFLMACTNTCDWSRFYGTFSKADLDAPQIGHVSGGSRSEMWPQTVHT